MKKVPNNIIVFSELDASDLMSDCGSECAGDCNCNCDTDGDCCSDY